MLHTKKYYIVYLDLLGSKNRIVGKESEKWLNVINELYSDAISYSKHLLNDVYTSEKSYVKIFSDNIIVAVEMPKELEIYPNSLLF